MSSPSDAPEHPAPTPFPQGCNTNTPVAPTLADTNDNRTPALPRQLVALAPKVRFACPWVKKHGMLGATGHSCIGKGWPTAHRVKEHIKRRHCPQITCPRCHKTFESQNKLKGHLKADVVCAPEEEPKGDPLRCTDEQMVELKPRRQNNLSEKDQWYKMFKVLFPGDTVMPSPYAHVPTTKADAGESAALQLHIKKELTTELRTIVLDAISDESHFPGMHSQMKSLIKTAFDNGLVQEAVARTVNKYKRSRISVDTTHILPFSVQDNPVDPLGGAQDTRYEEQEGANPAALPSPSNPGRFLGRRGDDQLSPAELQDQLRSLQPWILRPEISRITGLSPGQDTTAGASFDLDTLEELDIINTPQRTELFDDWLYLSPEPQQWIPSSHQPMDPGGLDSESIQLPEQDSLLSVASVAPVANGKRRASRSPSRDENEESESGLQE